MCEVDKQLIKFDFRLKTAPILVHLILIYNPSLERQ